jgi:histone H4
MGRNSDNQILMGAAVHTPALGRGRMGLKRLKRTELKTQPALTRPSMRRLARRAGVKRISAGIYEETPAALRTWLTKIVADACVFTEHARRYTVTLNDILMALKRNGMCVPKLPALPYPTHPYGHLPS